MRNFLICFCLLLSQSIFAQKEAWHWYFGGNAGIDFSSGTATLVTGALNTYEGCASISDTNGSLLFYTDGLSVYDRNHIQMPNGFGLFGDPSSTQSSIIIRLPGSSTIFYIFTVDYNLGINGFCYSTVDMTLNLGFGDVTTKNSPIRTPVYEKLTAVKHGNNIDYWILINDWTTDDIYSYALTSAGLNTIPNVSGLGPFHNLWIGATAGYFKANRQGNKLALAMWDKNSFDICDFDNLTGLASNHIVVQQQDMDYTYGAEFSPNGRYLYGTNMNPPWCHLYQFDLVSGTANGILNSRVTLDSSSTLYRYSALQIAPDGKIYCAHRSDYYAGVINDPDSAGLLCNYVDAGFNTTPYIDWLGLPNYPADYFSNLNPTAHVISDTSLCQEECINFTDQSTNNPVSWHWYFPGGNPSFSFLQNPSQVCYSTPGTYDVSLVVSNSNGTDSLFLPGYLTVFPSPPAPYITQSIDTLFCNVASNFSTFQWFYFGVAINGATDSLYIPSQNGTYQVEVHDSNGCRALVSTTFTTDIFDINNSTGFIIVPDAASQNISLYSPAFHENEMVTINISNTLGQNVLRRKKISWRNEMRIGIEDLTPGIYFVSLQSNATSIAGKFVNH
ncbi:MAG: PKD domain-containing protein [Bacteroidota bacterium]